VKVLAEGLKAVGEELNKLGLTRVDARERRSSVVLEGLVDSWPQYIAAGYAAAGKGYKGVVNDIEVNGVIPRPMYAPPAGPRDLEGQAFDVLIIGGGVIGCAVARELTRWNLSVALLEKEEDVAKQTSSRNNGMIHSGFSAGSGSKKLDYNIRGNRMYTQAAEELGFELLRCGLLALFEKGSYQLAYPYLRYKTLKKGIDGIELVSAGEVAKGEPNATAIQRGALSLPSTGIVAPYKVTTAYAENAVQNGARVFLNTVARGFEIAGGRIAAVETNRGKIRAGAVVNAAGVWSDQVAGLAGDRFFTIHGRKGTIAILDKNTGKLQNRGLALPKVGKKSHTKGGGLNPTVEGNILAGPTATEVPHREDWSTDPDEISFILQHHLVLNSRLKKQDIITYFAGIRACTFEEDFVIEVSEHLPNLIHAAGIQSPGLASAPAIAGDVARMAVGVLKQQMAVKPNDRFEGRRHRQPELSKLSLEERARLIESNPAYGRIICRCEVVSEGEVVDAIKAPVPATSLDAIKRRTRAGMGRCQGGFCTPALISIVAGETGMEPTAVAKGRPGSELLVSLTKTGVSGGKEAGEHASS
jgi:glycerol-3-phosphate dehydrogenase